MKGASEGRKGRREGWGREVPGEPALDGPPWGGSVRSPLRAESGPCDSVRIVGYFGMLEVIRDSNRSERLWRIEASFFSKGHSGGRVIGDLLLLPPPSVGCVDDTRLPAYEFHGTQQQQY